VRVESTRLRTRVITGGGPAGTGRVERLELVVTVVVVELEELDGLAARIEAAVDDDDEAA
jgi:hypothetical protein